MREVQARTGGFTAFICWPLQPENTPKWSTAEDRRADYLRTVAIARIVLDNVPNLQASWVTMGMKIGQIALRFGCNDFGSLMIEENVVSAANTTHRTTTEEMRRLIADAGFRPRGGARTTRSFPTPRLRIPYPPAVKEPGQPDAEFPEGCTHRRRLGE